MDNYWNLSFMDDSRKPSSAYPMRDHEDQTKQPDDAEHPKRGAEVVLPPRKHPVPFTIRVYIIT